MELENRDGDDLTSGDHLESVKRDSDSDTPPDQGKLVRFLFANKIEHSPKALGLAECRMKQSKILARVSASTTGRL